MNLFRKYRLHCLGTLSFESEFLTKLESVCFCVFAGEYALSLTMKVNLDPNRISISCFVIRILELFVLLLLLFHRFKLESIL